MPPRRASGPSAYVKISRRLRPALRVLRHPLHEGQPSQQADATRAARDRPVGRAGRARGRAGRPGHDPLRPRPGRARRPGRAARTHHRHLPGSALDSGHVCLPAPPDRAPAAGDGRATSGAALRRHAAAAHPSLDAGAHAPAASRHRRAGRLDAVARARAGPAHDLHRWLSGRDRGRVRAPAGVGATAALRPGGRLHLLGRRGHGCAHHARRTCRRRSKRRRRRRG